jgi:hypothetical protein
LPVGIRRTSLRGGLSGIRALLEAQSASLEHLQQKRRDQGENALMILRRLADAWTNAVAKTLRGPAGGNPGSGKLDVAICRQFFHFDVLTALTCLENGSRSATLRDEAKSARHALISSFWSRLTGSWYGCGAVEKAGHKVARLLIGQDGGIVVELAPPVGSATAPAPEPNEWDKVYHR